MGFHLAFAAVWLVTFLLNHAKALPEGAIENLDGNKKLDVKEHSKLQEIQPPEGLKSDDSRAMYLPPNKDYSFDTSKTLQEPLVTRIQDANINSVNALLEKVNIIIHPWSVKKQPGSLSILLQDPQGKTFEITPEEQKKMLRVNWNPSGLKNELSHLFTQEHLKQGFLSVVKTLSWPINQIESIFEYAGDGSEEDENNYSY